MSALDSKLNMLCAKLDMLRTEEQLLRDKQVTLGKEINAFFQEHDCPMNANPIELIKYFRQRKVLETL